jgi:hypothetical protein
MLLEATDVRFTLDRATGKKKVELLRLGHRYRRFLAQIASEGNERSDFYF